MQQRPALTTTRKERAMADPDYSTEIWKPIPGFHGLYEVSSHGRVKTLHPRFKPGRIMKARNSRGGYLIVGLMREGFQRTYSVHRLVAVTFKNPDPTRSMVNHINGIKTDNRDINLEWVTSSENCLHAYRIGLANPTRALGEKSVKAKLTDEIVKWIRREVMAGKSRRSIARLLGVSHTCVVHAANRKRWPHL